MAAYECERYPGHRAATVLIEDSANGRALHDSLRGEVRNIMLVRPDGDKTARALKAIPTVEAGRVHLPGAANATATDYDRALTPDWVQLLVDELGTFPHAAHDDQVDALTQMINWVNRPAPRLRVLG